MRCLQPATLALTALLWCTSDIEALRHSKSIPWERVRALIGDRTRQSSAPAHAPSPSASIAAGSPANAPHPSLQSRAAPAGALSVPPSPVPSPAPPVQITGEPLPSLPLAPAPVAAQAFAPSAAQESPVVKDKPPCPCPPAPRNVSTNRDLVDVATDSAENSVRTASAEAKQDTEYAIQHAGRQNLRGVQKSSDRAISDAGSVLKAHSDLTEDDIIYEMRNSSAAGQSELDSEAMQARAQMMQHVDSKSRQTTAVYIGIAQRQLGDLKEKMAKSGKEMTQELRNTITVGTHAERIIDKIALDAEVKANASKVLWSNTQKEVKTAQIDANNTEDAIRTSAIGTKFSSQAVEHAMKQSRKAYEMATQANLTGNMIIRDVMKRKAGIDDVTVEVLDALTKASKANIDAHQADMMATKMNKDALKLR